MAEWFPDVEPTDEHRDHAARLVSGGPLFRYADLASDERRVVDRVAKALAARPINLPVYTTCISVPHEPVTTTMGRADGGGSP